LLSSTVLFYCYHIIFVLGVHCDIGKDSCNTSNLSSPTTSFHFPHSWNSFNMYHFSIFIHDNIIFSLHSPSYTMFCVLSISIVLCAKNNLSIQGLLCFHMNFRIFFNFCKECHWNFDGDFITSQDANN
jgi:hypothetical protein